jgi:Sec-independent protein translocase protein TatA
VNILNIGTLELLFILLIALLVLGPDRLVSTARQVGRAATRLRRATENLPALLEEEEPLPPPEGSHPRPKATWPPPPQE